MRLGELGQALEMEIDLGRVLWEHGGAAARLAEAPVDPGAREARFLRRHMVVMQALRRVQDIGLADTELGIEMREQEGEVARIRLVGADILGRIDRVEGDAELAVAGGEAGTVDIRQDDELEVALEIG